MKKQKRRVFELRWVARPGIWRLCLRGGGHTDSYPLSYTTWVQECGGKSSIAWTKRAVIADAAREVRRWAPSQLVVKTKRGTISFERTYGSDPRRTKG